MWNMTIENGLEKSAEETASQSTTGIQEKDISLADKNVTNKQKFC